LDHRQWASKPELIEIDLTTHGLILPSLMFTRLDAQRDLASGGRLQNVGLAAGRGPDKAEMGRAKYG
jgi:hypothetical protein